VNGQALNFTVPTVNGTWTGLISNDGASLTGVWSQGSPTPLNLTRISATAADSSAPAPPLPPMPKAEVKSDTYTYKFSLPGTMAQVFENGKCRHDPDDERRPENSSAARYRLRKDDDVVRGLQSLLYSQSFSGNCCCARRATIGDLCHTDGDVTRPALGVILSRPKSDACFGDSLR